MWRSIVNRIRFFWLCVNPAFRWIGIVLGAVGMIALVQQEILPHPYADYRVFDFLPTWGWQGWLIVMLLVLLASAIEALYQYDTQGKPLQRILDSSGEPLERPRIRRGRVSTYLYPLVAILILALSYLSSSRLMRPKVTRVAPAVVVKATPLPTPSISSAIFMECHMIGLPITIPARTTLHLIPANKQYMKANHWGFYDIPNDSDQDVLWPDKKVLKDKINKLSKMDRLQAGEFGYRCEVSNHGPENVLYLGLPLDVNFDNDKPALRYEPVVPSLDANRSFVFYVTNDCPESASIIWQDVAKVETQQNPALHDVKLLRQYRDPTDQIMVFFGSKIQWAGQASCK